MKLSCGLVVGSLAAFVASAQVVQWNIAKRAPSAPILNRRQAKTIEEVITNEKTNGGYFATCKIGTPGQDVTLQLDTGSSDIWVPSSGAEVCFETRKSDGCSLGSYNPDDSSSFKNEDNDVFNISYVDGSTAKGHYFTDLFEIGDASISNMTIGLGLDTTIPYGLVGVGFMLNEATDDKYSNLPIHMQENGLIPTVAYSLWLNDLDASTGNILFGGIDTEKYKGDLTRIKILRDPVYKFYTSFRVALTSLRAVSDSGSDALSSDEWPITVVFDSGTTLSYLPTSLVSELWQEVGALYEPLVNSAVIPCSRKNNKGYFSFGFAGPGGPVINVTMDELVLPLIVSDHQPAFESGPYEGEEACLFGIQNFSTTSETFLLGDTFMRSAYVVYDLINLEIGLAPTDFNATESRIVAFESKGAPIPSSTAAPNQDAAEKEESPSYGASEGFQKDDLSSASKHAHAFDWPKTAIIGVSLSFLLVGV